MTWDEMEEVSDFAVTGIVFAALDSDCLPDSSQVP